MAAAITKLSNRDKDASDGRRETSKSTGLEFEEIVVAVVLEVVVVVVVSIVAVVVAVTRAEVINSAVDVMVFAIVEQ